MFFCVYKRQIGKCDDVNLHVDKDVVKRVSIDPVKIAQGGVLIEFIADGKLTLIEW